MRHRTAHEPHRGGPSGRRERGGGVALSRKLDKAPNRVYARLGEKKKRHRARIKFLVADMGLEKFREAVLEERAKLPPDPRWTEFLKTLDRREEKPLRKADPGSGRFPTRMGDVEYDFWTETNVKPQRQAGSQKGSPRHGPSSLPISRGSGRFVTWENACPGIPGRSCVRSQPRYGP